MWSLYMALVLILLNVPIAITANVDDYIGSFHKISSTQADFTAALANNDYFGYSISAMGDHNADSLTDLIAIGAAYSDHGGSGRGAMYIISINPNGIIQSFQTISNLYGDFTALLSDSDYFG